MSRLLTSFECFAEHLQNLDRLVGFSREQSLRCEAKLCKGKFELIHHDLQLLR